MRGGSPLPHFPPFMGRPYRSRRAKVHFQVSANTKRVRKSVVWWLVLLLSVFGPVRAEETSLRLSPPPEGEVQAADLVVSVTVSGPLGDVLKPETAKLFLDGRNVTGLSLRADGYLSYRPLNPLPPGPVKARLEFANGVIREWTFQVVPSQLIKSVSHNAQESLGEYQELTVTMQAEPGLKAGFTIDNERQEIEMKEVSPGLYQGRYTVLPGDYHLGVPIHCHLHLGDRVESRTIQEPANVFGHLFRVHIIEPLSGKAPSNNFLIKGRTRPGSKVSIVPRLSFNNNAAPPSSRWSSDGGGSIETKADEEGYFTIEYGIPIKVPNLSVVLSVFAVTPDGERSVPLTLRYRF